MCRLVSSQGAKWGSWAWSPQRSRSKRQPQRIHARLKPIKSCNVIHSKAIHLRLSSLALAVLLGAALSWRLLGRSGQPQRQARSSCRQP